MLAPPLNPRPRVCHAARRSETPVIRYLFKRPDQSGNNSFRIRLLPTSPLAQVRLPPQQLPGRVRRSDVESSVPGQKESRWEVSFDFEKVPAGEYLDLIVEHIAPRQFLQRALGHLMLLLGVIFL